MGCMCSKEPEVAENAQAAQNSNVLEEPWLLEEPPTRANFVPGPGEYEMPNLDKLHQVQTRKAKRRSLLNRLSPTRRRPPTQPLDAQLSQQQAFRPAQQTTASAPVRSTPTAAEEQTLQQRTADAARAARQPRRQPTREPARQPAGQQRGDVDEIQPYEGV